MSNNDEFLSGQSPIKSFKDVVPLSTVKPPIHKAAEFANITLTLNDFEIRKGRFEEDGTVKETEFAEMECMDNALETIFIRCGGYVVIRQLKKINKMHELPINFTLKKDTDGKTWYLD